MDWRLELHSAASERHYESDFKRILKKWKKSNSIQPTFNEESAESETGAEPSKTDMVAATSFADKVLP